MASLKHTYQVTGSCITYNVNDDIIPAHANSSEYWRHDVTKRLTDSCTDGHHTTARNVEPKHRTLLQTYTLWRKLDCIVANAYALRMHTAQSMFMMASAFKLQYTSVQSSQVPVSLWFLCLTICSLSPVVDNICAMMIVWRISGTGKILRTVLCWTVYYNRCNHMHTSSFYSWLLDRLVSQWLSGFFEICLMETADWDQDLPKSLFSEPRLQWH